MRHCEPYNCSHVPCRAYDMAAIKLRGMGKARTNFCKDRYKDEPFIQVPHCHCRCFCMYMPHSLLHTPPSECSASCVGAQANRHLDWKAFVLELRRWAAGPGVIASDAGADAAGNCGPATICRCVSSRKHCCKSHNTKPCMYIHGAWFVSQLSMQDDGHTPFGIPFRALFCVS